MNKNPYELRLDVMKMAQDMLDKEYSTKEMAFDRKLAALSSRNTLEGEDLVNFIDQNAPKMYTEEELLQKSKYLYDRFVSASTRVEK